MPKKPVNSNMVPLDGLGIIPERDAGKPPILDIRHLCVDFGGLRAVDDFTLLIGRRGQDHGLQPADQRV